MQFLRFGPRQSERASQHPNNIAFLLSISRLQTTSDVRVRYVEPVAQFAFRRSRTGLDRLEVEFTGLFFGARWAPDCPRDPETIAAKEEKCRQRPRSRSEAPPATTRWNRWALP